VQAVALARYNIPLIRLVLVGGPVSENDKAEVQRLKALVDQLGLADAVEFRGAVPFDAVHAAYRSADVYVNTSETGSMDKTVLEAMAMMVPVLTSNSAYRDVLPEPLARSSLVPHGNIVVLADRLQTLAWMTPEGRRELGANGRAYVVAEHSLEGLVERIITELGVGTVGHR
jgi:glycosyltransferase involved in cell wall biosynthesis